VPSFGTEAGAASRVEPPGSGVPATKRTCASVASGRPPVLAPTVLASARVDVRAPVATPLAPVVEPGWVSELLAPVAEKATATSGIEFPKASRTVAVSVTTSPAMRDAGEAVTSLRVADGAAGEMAKGALVVSGRSGLVATRA